MSLWGCVKPQKNRAANKKSKMRESFPLASSTMLSTAALSRGIPCYGGGIVEEMSLSMFVLLLALNQEDSPNPNKQQRKYPKWQEELEGKELLSHRLHRQQVSFRLRQHVEPSVGIGPSIVLLGRVCRCKSNARA